MIVRHVNGFVGFEIADDSPLAIALGNVSEKDALVARAEEQHAEHPQYRGHWSGPEWYVATVSKRVRTKMGVAFEPGDRTLVRAETERGAGDHSRNPPEAQPRSVSARP
jgi:hypothetical protein